jgi:hypothetical protein
LGRETAWKHLLIFIFTRKGKISQAKWREDSGDQASNKVKGWREIGLIRWDFDRNKLVGFLAGAEPGPRAVGWIPGWIGYLYDLGYGRMDPGWTRGRGWNRRGERKKVKRER